MRTRFFKSLAAVAAIAVVGSISASFAGKPAEKPKSDSASAASAPLEVDMFEGMKEGKIEVKYMAIDQSREAKLFITNKTKQPLNVKLPKTFGAVPVLAQFNGGGNQSGNQQGGQQNQNQQTGGGIGGQQGGQQQGGGGGIFNIAPEKVGVVKAPTVCLNHGLAEPTKFTKYNVKPLEEVIDDERVRILLTATADGEISQRIAQAASWHYANNMSWEELAAKKIERLAGPSEPFFRADEIRAAMKVAQLVEKKAQESIFKKSKEEKSKKSDKIEYKAKA
jgi:hypothetical protein